MPIVSAVIHTRPGEASTLYAQLAADPRLEVDGLQDDRFALVADTRDRQEDRELWRSLSDDPAILRIELVVAQFDDILPQEVP